MKYLFKHRTTESLVFLLFSLTFLFTSCAAKETKSSQGNPCDVMDLYSANSNNESRMSQLTFEDGDTIGISLFNIGSCWMNIRLNGSGGYGFGSSDFLPIASGSLDFEDIKLELLRKSKGTIEGGFDVSFSIHGQLVSKPSFRVQDLAFASHYFKKICERKSNWPPECCDQPVSRVLCQPCFCPEN